MKPEEILTLLKECREHYSKWMGHYASEDNEPMLNSVTGAYFALNHVIKRIGSRNEEIRRMVPKSVLEDMLQAFKDEYCEQLTSPTGSSSETEPPSIPPIQE